MNTRLITIFFVSIVFLLSTCKKMEKEILATMGEVTSITANTAVASGELVDLGNGVSQHGHCWAKSQNVSTSNSKTQLGIPVGLGGFSSLLEGLDAGSTYYINSYVTDGTNTVYGKETSFITLAASVPVLTTTVISSITATSAGSGGNITSEGGAPVTARGVCWGITSNPTTANSKTSDGNGLGIFTSNITNLSSGTIYYVRAYATNIAGTAYGNELSFTSGYLLPTLTTTALTSVTSNSAITGGNISNDGGAPVTARGVCWNITTSPTIENSKTIDGSGTGIFVSSVTGLTPGTTYYVRAYATNSAGTAYGNEVVCNASSVLPTLTTTAISSITSSTAISGGNITNDGGASITARGVCYGTSASPNITGSKTSDDTGAGSFTSNITGLSPGVTYYVRAYATNNAGTSYGNEISFAARAVLPSITTTSATSITATTAVSGGNVTNDGGSSVTSRGICWSTTANPTTASITIPGGTGSGSFVSSITGLTSNTPYYIRAYAENSEGTAYGNQVSFTTTILLPVVTTDAVSAITTTTATCGGNVSSQGGAPVTARGVCWGTTTSPTLDNSKTADGSGTGTFVSSLTGLIRGTTYYVRAYATNSGGTSYGDEVSFTAAIELPTLTTLAISNLTSTTANSGGSITNDGGAAVTARGVCWSTSPNPTTSNDKTTDGTGAGSFASNITNLNPNTTYYVRAYALNSEGTSYGNAIIFKTWTGTVSDVDGNVYNTVTIGAQVWMVENLKTTKYNDNTSIPLVTDISAWYYSYTPAFCWYGNDEAKYKDPYGALYNWYTIDATTNGGKNVCPTSWHVPTDTEWTTLTTFLGGESVAGGKMKEEGTIHWNAPNTGATNEVRFTALPGGYRSYNVSFTAISNSGWWWSYTSSTPDYEALFRVMNYDNIIAGRNGTSKRNGLSLRCIKD